MGNICRSPAAEIIWAQKVKSQTRLDTRGHRFDSAGTIAYHSGEGPDHRMQIALRAAGYKPFGTSRKIVAEDLDRFDLIFAMDRDNLQNIRDLAQQTGKPCDHCHLFLEYAGNTDTTQVPDPYYGGEAGFRKVIELVEGACDSILEKLAEQK